MSRIVALGEAAVLDGYALAGVDVRAAEDAREARLAWSALGEDVGLVILTPRARDALAAELAEPGETVWAVVPA